MLFIQPGNIVPLYQTDERYLKSFDKKYARFENSPIKNVDEAEINFYIFSVGKLGWINCDRFMEFEDKVDLMVDMNESQDLKLVFNEISSVLKPAFSEGKYVFKQVPAGLTATLIGIKNDDDGMQAAIEPITISNTPIKNLNYTKMTLRELRNKLEAI